jgi:hypothetical protein
MDTKWTPKCGNPATKSSFEALSKKRCPRCGNPDLLAIMVDVPQYVRDAVNKEKKRRGP